MKILLSPESGFKTNQHISCRTCINVYLFAAAIMYVSVCKRFMAYRGICFTYPVASLHSTGADWCFDVFPLNFVSFMFAVSLGKRTSSVYESDYGCGKNALKFFFSRATLDTHHQMLLKSLQCSHDCFDFQPVRQQLGYF